jgi:hypothetical protein
MLFCVQVSLSYFMPASIQSNHLVCIRLKKIYKSRDINKTMADDRLRILMESKRLLAQGDHLEMIARMRSKNDSTKKRSFPKANEAQELLACVLGNSPGQGYDTATSADRHASHAKTHAGARFDLGYDGTERSSPNVNLLATHAGTPAGANNSLAVGNTNSNDARAKRASAGALSRRQETVQSSEDGDRDCSSAGTGNETFCSGLDDSWCTNVRATPAAFTAVSRNDRASVTPKISMSERYLMRSPAVELGTALSYDSVEKLARLHDERGDTGTRCMTPVLSVRTTFLFCLQRRSVTCIHAFHCLRIVGADIGDGQTDK